MQIWHLKAGKRRVVAEWSPPSAQTAVLLLSKSFPFLVDVSSNIILLKYFKAEVDILLIVWL